MCRPVSYNRINHLLSSVGGNVNVEVDFYVPEDELAIQVSFSIADPETEKREKEPLEKLPNVHPCRRRIIITYDEESTLTDSHGTIEVIPCWKWLLEIGHECQK